MTTVADPVIAPAGGYVYISDTISITCATGFSSIYYTTDGSTPDNTKTVYTAPFSLTAGSKTVKAIGIKVGDTDSSVVSQTFDVLDPSTFTRPTAAAATLVYMNPSDVSTLTIVGGVCTNMADQSGLGNDALQTISGHEPVPSTRNGLTVLDFGGMFVSGGGRSMHYTTPLAGKHHFVVVGSVNGGGWPFAESSNYHWCRGDTGSGEYGDNYADPWTSSALGDSYLKRAFGSEYYLNGDYVDQESTGLSGDFDLISHATGSNQTKSTSTMFIDRAYHEGGGVLCELIIYDDYLTTTERQNVEGYLAWKWNLVNKLPSGHPYKTSPPGATNVATPSLSPTSSAILTTDTITITDSTSGADVYYTTDGSTPDATKTLYTTPFTLSAGTINVKAIGIKSGLTDSSVASETYTVSAPPSAVDDPVISPAGGAVADTDAITITDSTLGADIYYTIDGSTPDNTKTLYSGGFTLPAGTITVKAIGIKIGLISSSVVSEVFTVTTATVNTPAFSPVSGSSIYNTDTVTITESTSGADVYYTTDGSTPDASKTLYTGPFSLSNGTITVKAIGIKSGLTDSSVATATYTVTDAPVGATSFAAALLF